MPFETSNNQNETPIDSRLSNDKNENNINSIRPTNSKNSESRQYQQQQQKQQQDVSAQRTLDNEPLANKMRGRDEKEKLDDGDEDEDDDDDDDEAGEENEGEVDQEPESEPFQPQNSNKPKPKLRYSILKDGYVTDDEPDRQVIEELRQIRGEANKSDTSREQNGGQKENQEKFNRSSTTRSGEFKQERHKSVMPANPRAKRERPVVIKKEEGANARKAKQSTDEYFGLEPDSVEYEDEDEERDVEREEDGDEEDEEEDENRNRKYESRGPREEDDEHEEEDDEENDDGEEDESDGRSGGEYYYNTKIKKEEEEEGSILGRGKKRSRSPSLESRMFTPHKGRERLERHESSKGDNRDETIETLALQQIEMIQMFRDQQAESNRVFRDMLTNVGSAMEQIVKQNKTIIKLQKDIINKESKQGDSTLLERQVKSVNKIVDMAQSLLDVALRR